MSGAIPENIGMNDRMHGSQVTHSNPDCSKNLHESCQCIQIEQNRIVINSLEMDSEIF